MSPGRALLYFLTEAFVSLRRSFKVSLLAVLTIAVSLYVGGLFLLVTGNLASLVERWRREAKVVLYLAPDLGAARVAELTDRLGEAPWVLEVEGISSRQARERFRATFPSLADLMEGWSEEPLPPSLEVSFDPAESEAGGFDNWVTGLRREPGVVMVDDDRDWMRQVEGVVAVLRLFGLVLGAVLLGAAIFTIASVVRLTAFLYRDEIAVMRLVGATEFYIRGPFYTEGLIQGLAGGALASLGLYATYAALAAQMGRSVWGSLLTERFLTPGELGFLVGLGAAAGLAGAILSLRREQTEQ